MVNVSIIPSNTCSNPVIHSTSAHPIQSGATLTIDAWGGDNCPLSYQWQVQQGGWVDIPGATSATYFYLGLPKGEYTVRCIVTNTVGEMISVPVTFEVG